MTKAVIKVRFATRGAILALMTGMLMTLPAQAQDDDGDRGERYRAERPVQAERAERGRERAARRAPEARQVQTSRSVEAAPAQAGSVYVNNGGRGGYGGRRGDNSGHDWAAQRQARDAAAQQQNRVETWRRPGERRDGGTVITGGPVARAPGADGRVGGWQRDPSYGARTREWQREQRRDDARAERRDDARNYANGYRAGRYDDSRYDSRYGTRYGQNQQRWDNRGWRSDNRYDWYRYRASNRSLFSPGRYYAPYRGYSYSRINIGFRLGSPFYGNRYWINDPWQYRLPAVYGPYRWVRYYDDALLVDIYSGEVVDAIHNFFW